MIVKLLTDYHLEFLSLKGGCRGSSESTLVKMSNCWKSQPRLILCYSRFVSLARRQSFPGLVSGVPSVNSVREVCAIIV